MTKIYQRRKEELWPLATSKTAQSKPALLGFERHSGIQVKVTLNWEVTPRLVMRLVMDHFFGIEVVDLLCSFCFFDDWRRSRRALNVDNSNGIRIIYSDADATFETE